MIFQDAVRNNLKLLVVLPVVVALALVVAQVLFDRIRGWRLYRALIFLPYIVPVVVAALVFGQILQQNGLVNAVLRFLHLDFLAHDWLGDPGTAIWSLAGVVVWRELAFGVVLFLARMTQLPLDLYDAARVDGANWWQRLRHVTVPQMSTIIAFYCGIVLIALLSWVFNYVLVLTRGGPGRHLRHRVLRLQPGVPVRRLRQRRRALLDHAGRHPRRDGRLPHRARQAGRPVSPVRTRGIRPSAR